MSPPPGDPRNLIDALRDHEADAPRSGPAPPPRPATGPTPPPQQDVPNVRTVGLKRPPEEARPGDPAQAAPTEEPKKTDAPAKARPADLRDAEEAERLRLDPKVVGESKFDRVSTGLLSAIIGFGFAVGWLFLMVLTQRSYAQRAPALVEIIEVEGGGGGTPDGEMGATQEVNVSGADVADQASNNMEDATDFEPPTVELTSSVVIDALADVPPEDVLSMDIAEALPNAEMVATGQRASKVGTGNPFGFGPGPGGGVPREARWVIVFNPGQTLDEYARQLDYLRVELATPASSGSLDYASNFSSASPQRRSGLAAADKRLYFLWQGAGRKSSDLQLLQKAGINVGNKPIFQFYPENVENQLAQLEFAYAKRQPAEIRSTRFQVVPGGGGYEIRVVSQEPMQQAP